MKKKLLLGTLCLLLVAGCKDVKLNNGENAVVTFKEGGISAAELYNELKDSYGASKLMDLIDAKLLNEKYETSDDEKNYINQGVKQIKNTAKEANVDFELYLSVYYGVKDEKAFKDYLSLNYKRNLWTADYAKETVTDKQVNEYYEKEVYGDIDASQILITIDASSDASDDEKKDAENKALEKAKSIIKELKDGKDFAEAAKEYSKDSTNSSNGGKLGKVNSDTVESEVFDALLNLKDGSYTTSPVKSSQGYHILYRTSQDEKPELNDELTEEIKEKIGEEIREQTGFEITALKALREQNEMKFIDTDLEKSFNDLVSSQENSSAN